MQDRIGPRVSVRREGTADSGGGQLELRGERLVVQGKLRARDLGETSDLSTIALLDRDGSRAAFHFAGIATWTVTAEQGDLAAFARAMEVSLARPGLVQEPPRLSERILTEATPETRRTLRSVMLALVVAAASAVGTLWLRDESRQRAFAAEGARRAEAARTEDERRTSDEVTRVEQAATALAEKLRAALNQQRWRDAEAQHAALTKARPDHPMLRPAWATLSPALARLAEEERRAAVATGIADARIALADSVRCDDAQHVAGSWRGLAQTRPTDASWQDAVTLAAQLERCRIQVAKAYAANTAEVQRLERRRFALDIPDQLRGAGLAVVSRLGGRDDTQLTLEVAGLDDASARNLALTPLAAGKPLLEAAEALGVRSVRLRDGGRRRFDYALTPADSAPEVARALALLDLDEPFVLGDGSAAPAPVKKPARPTRSRRPRVASPVPPK